MWRPRLTVINTMKDLKPLGEDYILILAVYDGTTMWLPAERFETFCKVDVTYFPFDIQVRLGFSVWVCLWGGGGGGLLWGGGCLGFFVFVFFGGGLFFFGGVAECPSFVFCFVGCLTSQQHASVSQGFAQTAVRAATLRWIKHSISPSHSMLTPRQVAAGAWHGSHWSYYD